MSTRYPCGGLGRRQFLAGAAALPALAVQHVSAQEPRSAGGQPVAEEAFGIPGPYPGRVVEVDGISELVETLEEGSLVVFGAPGGSWLQRSMLGPGARLRSRAPAGAVMVRSAPDRVFRWMGDPVFVSPMRLADDTLLLHREKVLAVADEGLLIGLVRRELLEGAGGAAVGTLMEEALSAKVDETIAEAMTLEPTFGRDPIPVTDHDEHLVGALSLPVG